MVGPCVFTPTAKRHEQSIAAAEPWALRGLGLVLGSLLAGNARCNSSLAPGAAAGTTYVVTTPTADTGAIKQILDRAQGYFRQAIALDPTNTDAKLNLELVLRLTKPGNGKFGRDARAGYGFGRGRGVTPIGSGY